jgi:mannose-6-phosphate isomerase-like protein (cupin superfamily)
VLLHTHEVEEVLIFVAGAGEIRLGEDQMPVSAGTTVHISPGERHGFWNTRDETLRLFVVFPGTTFAETLIDES